MSTPEPVVMVTQTPVDGTVVRWYRTVAAAERHDETVSASRNGVLVTGYLTDVPPDWTEAAVFAYDKLREHSRADMNHLATHRQLINGPIEPVGGPS